MNKFIKTIFILSFIVSTRLTLADPVVPAVAATNDISGLRSNALAALKDPKWGCDKTPTSDDCKKLRDLAFNSTTDPCTTGSAGTDYVKAKEEFTAACSQANMGSNGPDDIGCGYKMTSCRCLQSGSSQIGGVTCPAKAASGSSSGSYSDVPDAKQAASQYKTCPALASRDSSNFTKDLDKAEDDVKSDRDKVNEAQDKVAKAAEDASTKTDELADKATEAQTKFGDDQEAAQKTASEAQKSIMDQLSQLQNQSLELDHTISQQRLAISQASIDAYQQKNQADLACHGQAVATVSKLQAEALELNRAGKLNLGGQRDILRKVGLSDRQHWEAMALKYYNWCLQSKPTLDAKVIADKMYRQKKATIEADIQSSKKHQALLADQMKQVKDPNEKCASPAASAIGTATSCPPSGSQYCQSLCQAAASQNKLFQNFKMTNDKLIAQASSAKNLADQKSALASQQAAQAQSQLADDNSRVTGLRNYLGVTRDAGGGSDDGKAYSNVSDKFALFNAAAGTLVSCKKPPSSCTSETVCKEAYRYLAVVGSAPPDALMQTQSATNHDRQNGPRTPSSTGGEGDSAN